MSFCWLVFTMLLNCKDVVYGCIVSLFARVLVHFFVLTLSWTSSDRRICDTVKWKLIIVQSSFLRIKYKIKKLRNLGNCKRLIIFYQVTLGLVV